MLLSPKQTNIHGRWMESESRAVPESGDFDMDAAGRGLLSATPLRLP